VTVRPAEPAPDVKKEVQAHFGALAARYRQQNYEDALRRGKYPDIFMRHRHMLELLDGIPAGRALEIGVGSGQMQVDLHARGHDVYGVDLSPDMARAAARLFRESHGRDGRLASADLERLCFADATFDLVVLAGVIEYLPDPARALAEIARVLRPGGWLVISVRNRFSLGRPLVALRDLLASYAVVGPLVRGAMAGTRRLLGREPDRGAVFARRDLPWRFRRALAAHGLVSEARAFYHFSIVPPSIERRFPGPCIGAGMRLERLSRTPLGWLGRGCIFKARRA
jgi:ubiquinone/menaquinone biosynthesis C-methylase UbiE